MQTDIIEELLRKARQRAVSLRSLPESTYRLQLHKGFTFSDASAVIPYLADLGITHVYTSPYLRAAPGSTHGYDVIDHCRLNPEFGSDNDYNTFIQTLANHGLSHILDTVPNHVGIATNENPWWNDVLESGPASKFGGYFDIAWRDSPRSELHDRVLVPILGEPYAKALEKGQLRLSFDAGTGTFAISYFDRRFPINPSSLGIILDPLGLELASALGPDSTEAAEYLSILNAIAHLPNRSEREPTRSLERRREIAVIKRRLSRLTCSNATVADLIRRRIDQLNGSAGDVRSFDTLDTLLCRQCYRLAFWQIASDEINYRRFFDINDLAALVMERQDVFEETHALTLRLLAEGKVAGLRIDHPDGLYDPEQYFRRLQSHLVLACARQVWLADSKYHDVPWDELRPVLLQRLEQQFLSANDADPLPLYVVAEKILAVDERLPRDWVIHGTSGYQFLGMVNDLFVDTGNADAFSKIYAEFIGDDTRFEELVYRNKRLIVHTALASELHMLAHRLSRLAQKTRRSRDFTHSGIREALAEVIACFPVYRTYITNAHVHEVDRGRINWAIEQANARNPRVEADLFSFLREVLLQEYPGNFTDSDREEQLTFAGKFQQLTAPVTAKGVEDTAFYVFNRLVSLNEVGGDPASFGIESAKFHAFLAARQRAWPFGLSALSTHDTKRSEDVRARLNVLSEIPGPWRESVFKWSLLNADHRRQLRGLESPSRNEEYLIYQTLIGAWPLDPYPAEEFAAFVKRVQAYMIKAMREAKVRTTWTEPDSDHETAVQEFIARICNPEFAGEFLADFRPFQQRIAQHGLINSLAQTLLKLTCPGAPDTYQGSELWDFSMVDPDNRRPVDYDLRRHGLQELSALRNAARENLATAARELTDHMHDGHAKLWTTWHALKCRRDHPGLFSKGEYLPLEVAGGKANNLFAFARHHDDRWVIVAVPRLVAGLASTDWSETRLIATPGLPIHRMRNVFTGEHTPSLTATNLFAHFPVALLITDA